MTISIHGTKLKSRPGFWRKNCEVCGKPLATSDIVFRSNGTATKANLKLLEKIPIVVTEEQVSDMRGDDVCKGYHLVCYESSLTR